MCKFSAHLAFMLFQKRHKEVFKMKTTQEQEAVYNNFEEYDEYAKICYFFSPAIGKKKIINGKTYFVRGYFKGGQDFESYMKRIATKQAYKKG